MQPLSLVTLKNPTPLLFPARLSPQMGQIYTVQNIVQPPCGHPECAFLMLEELQWGAHIVDGVFYENNGYRAYLFDEVQSPEEAILLLNEICDQNGTATDL